MLKRSNRLSRADFKNLRHRRRESGKYFSLAVAEGAPGMKFACVVPKKAVSKANDRNLIKRRARAAIREIAPTLVGGFVFTAKAASRGASYEALLSDLRSLLQKVTH